MDNAQNTAALDITNLLSWPAAVMLITVVIFLIAAAWFYMEYKNPRKKRVVIRFNVLTLMSIAYGIVLTIFIFLVSKDNNIDATKAWNILEAPLMALIGGTLAISKDLINDDDNNKDSGNDEGGLALTTEDKAKSSAGAS